MESKQPLFRRIFWWTLAVIVAVIAGFITGSCWKEQKSVVPLWGQLGDLQKRIVNLDSLADYLKNLKQDTVIKWYEKPFKKEAKPETVFVSKDSIIPDTIWGHWPEAIIDLEKKGHKLSFTSLVPADSWNNTALVKEYLYDVETDFSIKTKGDGFYVEKPRGFWTKFYGGLAINAGFKLWGDSTMPFVEPAIRGYIGWGPVSVGPTVTLYGIQLTAEAGWRF